MISEQTIKYIIKLGISVNQHAISAYIMVRRWNSTSAEEIARFQCLFPNLSWVPSVVGKTSGHLKLVPTFPLIELPHESD